MLTGRSDWLLRIRSRGPHHSERVQYLSDRQHLGAVLADVAGDEPGHAGQVEAQIHPHAPGAFMTPGCDSLYAATCLSVGIHLPHLFSRGGPLFDPALIDKSGRLLPGALGAGGMQRARRFAAEHARHFVFPPSAVLASYDTVYLFFQLAAPLSLLERERVLIDKVQDQLAGLIHGGYARRIGSWIPLPLRLSRGGKPSVAARLLWVRKDRVWNLEKLDRWTAVSAEAGSEQRHSGGAPEMRLRTLMDDYGLADLELSPAMRQLVAAGSCGGEVIVLDEVPFLVEAMASAGYGYEDVRLVVADSRFPLSFSARLDTSLRQGLALRFRNALRAAGGAYPPRLPYGITSITLLADGDDRSTERYVVVGGAKAAPFRIEVSHDVLISARRFHRALASHLKGFPYRVPQEVWEQIVLRRGLGDPRIRLQCPPGPDREELPLLERVRKFAAEAKPLDPWLWESGDSIPWPVLRDGQVVFRLAVLRERLADEIRGPAPRRGEVTAAVRAAGGAPYGAMRFGKRVIRVWTLPYPGRLRTPAPRRGRPPA